MRISKKIVVIVGVALLCAPSFVLHAVDTGGEQGIAPLGERTELVRQLSQALAQTCRTGAGQAPTMVVIKPGHFQMGSPEDEADRQNDEGPLHDVKIPNPFAISRCEITVGQFRQFVEDKDYHQGTTYLTINEQNGKGCRIWNEGKDWDWQSDRNWKNPSFTQSDDHPVVCVSWDDAQAYVTWLSHRTGAVYRLPTEAEWEYMARAGTQTRYWWGNDIGNNNANCDGCGSQWDNKQTAPVGSFQSNSFGLFDTAGNVWEWTQDCWHDNYDNAPKTGLAWLEQDDGDCNRRVVRGGSWDIDPRILRSANRYGNSSSPFSRSTMSGFVSPGLCDFDLCAFVLWGQGRSPCGFLVGSNRPVKNVFEAAGARKRRMNCRCGDYKYIWQAGDWPEWRYDLAALAGPLAEASNLTSNPFAHRLAAPTMN